MTWDFQGLMADSPALATRIKESADARSWMSGSSRFELQLTLIKAF